MKIHFTRIIPHIGRTLMADGMLGAILKGGWISVTGIILVLLYLRYLIKKMSGERDTTDPIKAAKQQRQADRARQAAKVQRKMQRQYVRDRKRGIR